MLRWKRHLSQRAAEKRAVAGSKADAHRAWLTSKPPILLAEARREHRELASTRLSPRAGKRCHRSCALARFLRRPKQLNGGGGGQAALAESVAAEAPWFGCKTKCSLN